MYLNLYYHLKIPFVVVLVLIFLPFLLKSVGLPKWSSSTIRKQEVHSNGPVLDDTLLSDAEVTSLIAINYILCYIPDGLCSTDLLCLVHVDLLHCFSVENGQDSIISIFRRA